MGQTPYFSAGLNAQFGKGILPGIGQSGDPRDAYVYREHFLEISAGYETLMLWTNLEFSSPPQIGPTHLGLRKARLSWEGTWASLSIGDLYGQVGRGLALNLWENQSIDWDSSLRGIWLTLRPVPYLNLNLIGGRARGGRHLPLGPGVEPRRRDFSDDARLAAAVVSSSRLISGLTTGGYLANVIASNPWFSKRRNREGNYEAVDSTNIETRSWIPGMFFEYFGRTYDLYVEITARQHEIVGADSLFASPFSKWLHYETKNRGWGGYAAVSFFPGKWGITMEYKNYLLDNSDPDKRRNLPMRLGRSSSIQNPPTVFREHASTLLSRTPHVMDFEDEVGIQVEINRRINRDLFLLFNYSQSSRHYGYTKTIKSDFRTEWKSQEVASLLWTDMGERYYPFREIYGELNYHNSALGLDFEGMVSVASEVLRYDASRSERAGVSDWLLRHSKGVTSWEKRNLITIPLEVTLAMFPGWGLTVSLEHQWEDLQFKNYIAFEDRNTGKIDSVTTDKTDSVPYYYRYAAVTLGKPSNFTIGVIYDSASEVKTGQPQNVDPDDDSWLEALVRRSGINLRNKWFGLQLTKYLTASTILSIFYGSLQGGLKCDSGVCVYVPGIEDAFTVTLTGNF